MVTDKKNQKISLDLTQIYKKLEEKNKKDKLKLEVPSKESPKKEEVILQEAQKENPKLQEIASSSNGGFFPSRGRAPVLESVSSSNGFGQDVDSGSDRTKTNENITETRDRAYLVRDAPKYSATDYNFRGGDSNDRPIRTDNQMDITGGRLMHSAPVLRENNEIRLGAWQQQNVFTHAGWNPAGELSEKEYHILGTSQKKKDDRLPFQ